MNKSLSKQQSKSIDFMVNSILNKEKIIAFIAPGGCGKTFTLGHLSTDERLENVEMTFTATTNKASSVMKKEGIKGAITLHSAISLHIPTEMFRKIASMYTQSKKKDGYVGDFPKEVSNFLSEIKLKEEDFFNFSNEKEMAAEMKIDMYDERIFSHFATCDYLGGVISIDESSMLPKKSLYNSDGKLQTIGVDIVSRIYDTVILVGDDSQLPPIKGKSSFDDIEKTVLTKNFRSEKGLLRLLECARNGENLANFVPRDGENVVITAYASDEYFDKESIIENNITHIVYKNKTRHEMTKRIRGSLSSNPVKDEPIVYKGATIDKGKNNISKNEIGYFNGVMGEWDNHTQVVSGRNFDEYGKGFTYMSYAYAITCHTAQGSSFDYVVVHMDDIPHFIDEETRRKWVYTAVSRAKKGIVIVY